MLDKPAKVQPTIPFDADRLDRLMDEAGIDVLCATSKHNICSAVTAPSSSKAWMPWD